MSRNVEAEILFPKPVYLLFIFVLFKSNRHCKGCLHEQSEFDSAAANLVEIQNC